MATATLLGTAAPSWADEFDVENFRPVSPGDGALIAVQSTRQLASGSLAAGVSFGLVDDPLVVVDNNDDRVAAVVGSRFGADLMAAYGLGPVELSLALPLILYQNADADPETGMAGVENGGIGDMRVGGRARLLSLGAGMPAIGAGLTVTLPTSVSAEFGGQSGPTASPYLVADLEFDAFVAAVNVGARVRESEGIGDLAVGSAFTYGAGGAVRTPLRPVWVMAELAGEVAGGNAAENPLEARGGVRGEIGHGLTAAAGYGHGLVHGYGAPDHRVFASLTFRPEAEPAPLSTGTVVATPAENPDPDGDGILGADDACPDKAEDFDGFNDRDGCPESDNDNDRIADAADSCPNHAEDVDQYQDEDGCPDPDNDFDGLADKDDRCPLQAEVINGNEDDDGCPDEGKVMVVIGKKKLEIQDKIYFATGKDVILPRSEGLITQVAKTIERNPWIKQLRIEGHTDNVGKDAYNLDLSQRRAAAVRKALIAKGVADDRIESVGYGEQNPIDSNSTLDGRAHNRRVEFVITDQDDRPQADAAATQKQLNGGKR